MRAVARVLREPLVHFLLIGIVVFAFYALAKGPEAPPRDRIVVSKGRIQQRIEIFARTWQRPPTAQELRGLVASYVKEEVYYREALKLGLDRDDPVIRRHMQRKMEFLIEPPEAELQASNDELAAFLAANRERFSIDPRISFQQVFINPTKPGPPAALRAARTLDELRSTRRSQHPQQQGDPTLLPYEMPLTSLSVIARSFGAEFAERLTALPQDEWSGTITSAFGLHIVRVTARQDGRDPPLAEVREAVMQEWRRRKRLDFAHEEYQRLLDGYEVVLPSGDAANAPAP